MNTTADATLSATWAEIHAQPEIWRGWAREFDPAPLRQWVSGLGVDEVWFCGAGSSAYIGDILASGLDGASGPLFRSVPSTDIVARPALLRGRRPLVVSFGRSGNSAETVGTLDALDALAPDAPRLNITCNAASALATRRGKGETRVVVLPAATHDAGFAMTSSFSTMLLTALAIFGVMRAPAMTGLAAALDSALPGLVAAARATPPAARIVFLGTGPLTFAAREAALKVMELTAGRTAALWDSALGFRHGPKSFVQDGTLVALLRSTDPHAARYETDLAAELRAQFPRATLVEVGPGCDIGIDRAGFDDLGAVPLYVAYAQVLAVVWSAAMGLNIDDPFAGLGTLTRVVSGVRLYEVPR